MLHAFSHVSLTHMSWLAPSACKSLLEIVRTTFFTSMHNIHIGASCKGSLSLIMMVYGTQLSALTQKIT